MKRLIFFASFWVVQGFAINQTPDHSANLNQMMNISDQKQTGVNKLSKSEREALEAWLNNYSVSSKPPINTTSKSEKVSSSLLVVNIEGGKYLQLNNNTVWQVDPNDVNISSAWLTPVLIVVRTNPGNPYPFKLTNDITKEFVLARRSAIELIPKPLTQEEEVQSSTPSKQTKQNEQNIFPSQRNDFREDFPPKKEPEDPTPAERSIRQ